MIIDLAMKERLVDKLVCPLAFDELRDSGDIDDEEEEDGSRTREDALVIDGRSSQPKTWSLPPTNSPRYSILTTKSNNQLTELFDYRSFHTSIKFLDNRDVIVFAVNEKDVGRGSSDEGFHPQLRMASASPFFFTRLPALKRPMRHAIKVSELAGDSQMTKHEYRHANSFLFSFSCLDLLYGSHSV
ncbi:hypothetical protein EDD85DRAFT_962705 [Armillaria nabsnona]|nr:hypothetical protein EDD85DRAFT_962705 [Armillaria nabsnona]